MSADPTPPPLPIDEAIPALRAALSAHGRAVLVAPPGAGKTTRVPLALMDMIPGRILMLEPRRLAARAAAERMAATLGQPVGGDVGYRVRGDSVPGARIEVVTEGILTRMVQSDPALTGTGCVIFDEFHERSLNADLGLALAWESRAVLRPDLAVLVMSATLDAEPVAALLDDAPVVRSLGRAFPVDTRWLDRPLPAGHRLVPEAARLVARAEAETRANPGGTILVFLPGEGEIRRVAAMLDLDAEVVPLFGAMDFAAQRAALAPPGERRRIVLATAIAETSLTIPGVRVVVDAGRARRARFDPGSGMSRLVTERVSRAEAEQRRGRAGRVAPGLCYRMWARAEEGGLSAFAPPEMATADLTGLALELAAWGSAEGLVFLTPPPAAALAEARALLAGLGALDADGRITGHGRAMAALPLHPRLAHMLLVAGRDAADLAALLAERDPIRGAPADLALRLAAIRDPRGFADRHPWPADRATIERIRAESRRLRRLVPDRPAAAPDAAARPAAQAPLAPAASAALAYPDRIGLRRRGEAPRFVLSGGKGAVVAEGDPLGAARLIVATDLNGDLREARVRMGATLDEADLRALYGDRIERVDRVDWSRREGRVLARRQDRLGALVLADQPLDDPDPQAVARAAWQGLRDLGLPWTPAARRLRARIALVPGLPDVSDAALLDQPAWLLPWLETARTAGALRALDLTEPLKALIGWDGQRLLDQAAPAAFTSPLGRRIPIDYDAETPTIEARLQELFGVTRHPIAGSRPLRIVLLSPGGKPVAVTTDLPGFWAGGYGDVRRDMRGRYPRHPWPEDPTAADPTLRAKPRGT
ncbi:ATP-dependent helicase HrpB [Paracoccus endophyticus]|uniref:ATP-dependent helicase HrpB n=1 Tax=Paracoccus endophyticus TaxID=2233774 RepID=UPI000DDB36EB|nr:ATP-dependent helicase HrpB [Paracoccus endophyticus]